MWNKYKLLISCKKIDQTLETVFGRFFWCEEDRPTAEQYLDLCEYSVVEIIYPET